MNASYDRYDRNEAIGQSTSRLSPRANARTPYNAPARSGLIESTLLAAIAVTLWFAYYARGESDESLELAALNLTASTAQAAVLAFGCWTLLARSRFNIWHPGLWFRLASLLYFSLGAAMPYLVNDTTRDYMQELHAFSDAEILKSNVVVATALLCALGTERIVTRWQSVSAQEVRAHRPAGASLQLYALAFLIVGGSLRYLVVVPAMLEFSDATLPSLAPALAKAYSAGIMLAIMIGLRERNRWLTTGLILAALDLITGLLLFSKSDVLVTLLFVVLAAHHERPRLSTLVVGISIIAVLYSALVPIVTYGRDHAPQIANGQPVGLLQRMQLVERYWRSELDETQDMRESGIQLGLARLSYTNVATLVIGWHDFGRPGDTLEHATAALVPRLLWPGKPDLSVVGTDLFEAVFGQTGTSISAGWFAEAYWNFGWIGIPLLFLPVGVLLAALGRLCERLIRAERWLYLPVVLMAVQIGSRVDGYIVIDVIGPTAAIAVGFLGLRVVEFALALHRNARMDRS